MKTFILLMLTFMLSCELSKKKSTLSSFWQKTTLEECKKRFSHKDSINKKDSKNLSYLMKAVMHVKDTNILDYLVSTGGDLFAFREPKRQETVLILALYEKPSLNTITFLLNRGLNVRQATRNGVTPFMICVRNKDCSIEVANLLLKHGAKIDETDLFKRTAFYYAVAYNPNVEMILFLKRKGANVNIVEGYKGWNVFFTAVVNGRDEEYFKELVKMGISYKKVTDIHGDNLIVTAIKNGRSVEFIRFLAEMGVSPHAKTKDNQNSFMFAMNTGDIEVIKQLLRWKVNYKLKDHRGKNAAAYASSKFKKSEYYDSIEKQILK